MSYPMSMAQAQSSHSTEPVVNIPPSTRAPSAILDELITARVHLLLDNAFFGSLACGLKFVDATLWCPTAATDGVHFYYNRDFVDALSKHGLGQLIFLVGHEVLHCVYDHMMRRGDRHPVLWNIAIDRRVNYDLMEARVGERITLVEILYDHSDGKDTSEVIYDRILEEMGGDPQLGKLPGNMKTLDSHIDPDSNSDQATDGDANDGTQGPVKYTQSEREEISNNFRNQVIQAARQAGGAGNMPGGLRRLVNDLLNPQLDWRELLTQRIQSLLRSNYTYQRLSRKSQESGFILPGMDRDTTINIAVAIDLSGSITSDQVRDFLSEIKGIMDQHTDFEVTIFCFDTSVHNTQKFDQYNMDEFLDYELVGGGGTDFMCCYDHMKQHDIQPGQFVMFTDLYPCGSFGDPDYCDTIFIAHDPGGNHDREAPFGTTVWYERPKAA